MARDPASIFVAQEPLYRQPWVLLAAGLGCALPAWLVPHLWTPPVPLRLGMLFVGTLLLFAAVIHRLRQTKWELPDRIESAAIVSLAGLGSLLGYLAMDKEWDSGLMFYVALFILCAIGAVLILLPPLVRRFALSAILLFHFGGMAVAITSVDPPNSTGPWLSKQLLTRVYRPYLSFLYMSNAYHFYSPDPGPPTLLWFAVHYSDGSYTWIKLPDRGNSPIGMHYQRLLALPELSFTPMPGMPLNALQLSVLPAEIRPEHGSWEEIFHRRELGSTLKFRPKGLPIPMVMDLDATQQYREPTDSSKMVLAAVAKRILQTAPSPSEEVKPVSVKMYRVVHLILSAQELARGVSPWDPTKYLPYFLGEFDREGQMKDPNDPFLYWYLPIVTVAEGYPDGGPEARPGIPAVWVRNPLKSGSLLDCLEMHAAGQSK